MFVKKLSQAEYDALSEQEKELYNAWLIGKQFDAEGNVVTGDPEDGKKKEEENKIDLAWIDKLPEEQRNALRTHMDSTKAEALADIKGKLGEAYTKFENLKTEVDKAKKEKEDAARAALESEGKWKELRDSEKADYEAQITALNARITGLTRDTEVSRLISPLNFRNTVAQNVAVETITKLLKQDSSGSWVGPNGQTIAQVVANFANDKAYSFLFNPKDNSGEDLNPGGSPKSKAPAPKGKNSGAKSNADHMNATLAELGVSGIVS